MVPQVKALIIIGFSAAMLIISPSEVLACPSIGGVPDFNCDGTLQVAVMGDSIVYGTGDTVNHGHGGYVTRAEKLFPSASFINLGDPGAHSLDLLQLIEGTFRKDKDPEVKSALLLADVVVLDIGRNDRWEFGPTLRTYRNLKKAASKIKSYVTTAVGYPPMVVTAVLLLPNRGSQGPWVKELNQSILKGSTTANPADLRFDLVSKRLLGSDQIHPTVAGYKAMAKTLVTYLKKKLPAKMRKVRPDTDVDGIPDIIETATYSTNPVLADTDADGHSDGDEVFTLHTNPLVAD